jgi:predicted glutamine amidotransferase
VTSLATPTTAREQTHKNVPRTGAWLFMHNGEIK